MAPQEPRYRWDGTGMTQGDLLLSCLDTPAWMQGVVDFHHATALTGNQVIADPLITTALPAYPGAGTQPRWEQVHTAAMWHPLFWLPERLRPTATADGDTEPVKVWVLRVGLELNASTLYEPDRGWRDILADQGVDLLSPNGLDRMALWQAGRSDELLDTFTVEPYLCEDHSGWAMEMARTLILTAQERLWALVSDELIGWIDELAEGDTEQALMVTMSAEATLLDARPDASEVWARTRERIDRATPTALGPARAWLEQVRSDSWPSLQAIQDEFTQGAAA